MKNLELVNFEIINNLCKWIPFETFYKTVERKDLKKSPKKEKPDALAAMARCPRTHLHVQGNMMVECFKTLP